VNVALLALTSFYLEGHLVGTGNCSGMGCIDRLWNLTFGGTW